MANILYKTEPISGLDSRVLINNYEKKSCKCSLCGWNGGREGEGMDLVCAE